MYVRGLVLQSFRCHRQLSVQFSPTATVIVGRNASGKTSIIEALSLLSTGESFRAEHDDDMIGFEAEMARLKTKVEGGQKSAPEDESEEVGGSDDELEMLLTRGLLQGKVVQKKHVLINNARKRKKDLLGLMPTVLFRPEDMRLIEGSPTRRRHFLDTLLCATSREYLYAHTTYEQSLRRRNRVIDQVRDGTTSRTALTFWTQSVIKHGMHLQEARRAFFQECHYEPFPLRFEIEYLPSVMSEERMQQYADKEIAAGHTLIGPHKDDFLVHFSVPLALDASVSAQALRDVAQFGSRGQQRLAVLWLKMNELKYIHARYAQRPLLLLDDLLSELDSEHRAHLEPLLATSQSIITTTEESIAEQLAATISDLQLIRL